VLAGLVLVAALVGCLDRYEQKHVCPESIEAEDWAGRTKITYWEKWSGPEFQAIKDAVEAYNRTQGETDRVFVDLINTSQVNVKTMIFTAGGQPPDLAGNWSVYVAPFAERGALTPLDAFAERDGYDLGAVVKPYLDTCRYAGKLWAMPIVPATTALFYNRRMFREAGLDPDKPPKTIAELDAMARKIDVIDSRGNIVRMGFLHTEPGWWKWSWGYYFGGRITDGKGGVLPETDPWIRSLEWANGYAEHYGRGAVASVQSGFGKFDSPQNAFVAGRVGMVIQGVWMPNFINRYNRGLEYAVAPFPSEKPLEEGHPVTQVETDCITIPKGAKHPEEAWKFIKWLAGPKGAGILCMGQGKHTCLRELPEEFVRENPNPHVKFFPGLAFSKNASIVGRFAVLSKFREEMSNAFEEVWHGRKSPEKAVADAQEQAQDALDRNVERWGHVPPEQ
jgi:ABC-type glycerol-3-phosphate transport system substrate-binding protein